MTAAILVRGLGKRYALGEGVMSRQGSLRDALADRLRRVFSRGTGMRADGASEEFWALRDVDLDVQSGERVGIIGRNGAGKSTLLKLLTRITSPTTGRIQIVGRSASLLEVGTGFHPELSGRENVFLNGAILGMSRSEIRRKFDDIVSFAEVERFIDTPVKRYSSGMYVRLAFAVAAHLDPDILIVDEVLAVGDARFQEKCLGVLRRAGEGGVTVLFVSHNMGSIRSLCSRCVLLDGGMLVRDGPPDEVVSAYLGDEAVSAAFERPEKGGGAPTITRGSATVTREGDEQRVRIDLTIAGGTEKRLSVDVRLFDAAGAPVGFGSLAGLRARNWIKPLGESTQAAISLPVGFLVDGRYFISLDLTLPAVEYFDRLEHVLTFELSRPPGFGERRLTQGSAVGIVELPLQLEDVGCGEEAGVSGGARASADASAREPMNSPVRGHR